MQPRYRVAMYSHDTMGLGHTRRNLLIAHALAGPPLEAMVLIVTGACESTAFSMPPGADCLALPALRKNLDGSYRPRRLGLSLKELIAVRTGSIRAALEAFEPDALIVDKLPRGMMEELEPALGFLRRGGKTRCVLGLRDVLDDSRNAIREWTRPGNDAAVRDYYDAVWVYGDPVVFDPVREYRFSPEVASKVRFTGYLDQSRWLDFETSADKDLPSGIVPESGRVALCLVGGGQDGAPLAEAFLRTDFSEDTTGVLLTGPLMPEEERRRLQRLAKCRSRLRVIEFLPQPAPLLKRADRIVAMGGYNTIGEVLSFGKTALIVPRVRPRTEQLIRAARLVEMGLLDLLHPDEVSPRLLGDWLRRDLPSPRVRERIDLCGLSRIPAMVEEMLVGSVSPPWIPAPVREVMGIAI